VTVNRCELRFAHRRGMWAESIDDALKLAAFEATARFGRAIGVRDLVVVERDRELYVYGSADAAERDPERREAFARITPPAS